MTFTVTSNADSGLGTLRQAILDSGSGDTILFSITGTITLTSGELEIDHDLTITGPGSESLTIDGDGAYRVFNISGGAPTISGLTISGAYKDGDGGGIFNEGTLTLTDFGIAGCSCTGNGGGIYNSGTLVFNGGTVDGNTAGVEGGGVYNSGTFTGQGAISTNDATSGNGSGVFNSGSFSFSGGRITDNTHDGVFNGGSLSLVETTVDGNAGAGVSNQFGTVFLTRCTISNNESAALGDSVGSVTIETCTFSGNVFNLFYTNNSAIDIRRSTFDTTGTGYLFLDAGSILYIQNTILLGLYVDLGSGASVTSDGNNIFGIVQDYEANDLDLGGSDDVYGVTPEVLLLGPLQDNGGPTFTCALLPGSPALDTGNGTGAPATDQRGFTRIVGEATDVGAYEATPLPPVAGFTFTPETCVSPIPVAFTDTSTGGVTGWLWDFGDGSPTSTEQNPTHNYATVGSYLVTLTVTNASGSDSDSQTVTPPAGLEADFSMSASAGETPLEVVFTDLSTEDALSWSWDFGDGSPVSTDQNPTHEYDTPGLFTVTLTVTWICGSLTFSRDIEVVEGVPTSITECVAAGTYCQTSPDSEHVAGIQAALNAQALAEARRRTFRVLSRVSDLDSNPDTGGAGAVYAANAARIFFADLLPTFTVIDARTNSVVDRVTVTGQSFESVEWNGETGKVYFLLKVSTLDNSRVLIYDPETLIQEEDIDLGFTSMQSSALDPAHNRIYFCTGDEAGGTRLVYLDCDTNTVTDLGTPFGTGTDFISLTWCPTNGNIYASSVESGRLYVFDTSSNTVLLSTVITGERIEGMFFSQGDGFFYIPTERGATWFKFDPDSNTVVGPVASLAGQTVAFAPHLREIWNDCVHALIWPDGVANVLNYFFPEDQSLIKVPLYEVGPEPAYVRPGQPVYVLKQFGRSYIYWNHTRIRCP